MERNEYYRQYFPELSADALAVIDRIGEGMRLRVPHDGAPATIAEGHERFGKNRPSLPVSPSVVEELLNSKLMFKLTRDGERDRYGNGRGGWKEAGYDGDVADWYVMIQ